MRYFVICDRGKDIFEREVSFTKGFTDGRLANRISRFRHMIKFYIEHMETRHKETKVLYIYFTKSEPILVSFGCKKINNYSNIDKDK